MKFGIVTFPGSNCDYDAYRAVIDSLGEEAVYLWHKEHDLKGADVVVLPGGFSYGDYLRPGAIARFSPIMTDVGAHAARGGPVLGICNGFQIACEAGLLPGAVLRNESLKFVSKVVTLRVEQATSMFTNRYRVGQELRMPIAHGDGRYTADEQTLDRLDDADQVLFRYVAPRPDAGKWWSPNGAMRAIAGIVSESGNVLGMMPHPERAMDPLLGSVDGAGIFESLLATVAA
ncbi:MAG TPA: phosphoribosylformylglycinamidine synthase subunit PurQ [Gemmatimonadaceae bacterium]|nr:phosphoribosylformylglycinamidine synthase subunit PurQ [Gemmatimonadaceae bacterium]